MFLQKPYNVECCGPGALRENLKTPIPCRRFAGALYNLLLYGSRYLKHHVLEFYGVNVDRWGVRAGVLAIQITDSVTRL